MFLSLNRFAGVVTLAMALVGGSLPSQAAAAGLTLAESERIAVDRDAMLREMHAQGAAMRERAVMDGELMDPQLRVGAVNVPVDSFSLDAEDMTMLEVGVVQEFQPGKSRRLSRKQMEQLATAMDATALDRSGSYGAKCASSGRNWPTWARRKRCSLTRRAGSSRCASPRGRVTRRARAGNSTCCRPGLDAAMLREQQLDLDRDEAMYRSQLSFWLGADDAARAQPADCRRVPSSNRSRRSRHGWTNTRRNWTTCDASTPPARQKTWRASCASPRWMLDVSYGFRQDTPDGMSRPDMLSAMVTVGPAALPRRPPGPRGQRRPARGAGSQRKARRPPREMQAMLVGGVEHGDRTAELERFYETDLLPLAEQSVTAALLGWRSNRAMFDEVVMARRLALETKMKHLRLAADRALAQHEIDYLAGDAR